MDLLTLVLLTFWTVLPMQTGCPHAPPDDGERCTPPTAHACTYSGGEGCQRLIATCRDGAWRVECMDPPAGTR